MNCKIIEIFAFICHLVLYPYVIQNSKSFLAMSFGCYQMDHHQNQNCYHFHMGDHIQHWNHLLKVYFCCHCLNKNTKWMGWHVHIIFHNWWWNFYYCNYYDMNKKVTTYVLPDSVTLVSSSSIYFLIMPCVVHTCITTSSRCFLLLLYPQFSTGQWLAFGGILKPNSLLNLETHEQEDFD